MEIKKKAYKINTSKFREPWFIPETIFYGKIGKVKQEAVRALDGIENSAGEEITYLNVPVERAKDYDVFEIDGVEITRENIEYKKQLFLRDEALDKLLAENPKGYAYIIKGGYYYRSVFCGYTEQKHEAGIYLLEQAIKECKSCDLSACMQAIVINKEEHNNLINSKIQELKIKLID